MLYMYRHICRYINKQNTLHQQPESVNIFLGKRETQGALKPSGFPAKTTPL